MTGRHASRGKTTSPDAARSPLRPVESAAAVVLFVGVIALVAWAAFSTGRTATNMRVFTGHDVSASMTVDDRRAGCRAVNAALESALPRGGRVTAWTFFAGADKVYDGVPGEITDLVRMEKAVVAEVTTEEGTRPAEALEAMAREAARAGGPVVVMLVWDGDDDAPRRTRAAADALAGTGRVVACWVVGVDDAPGLRAHVERALEPLGDALIVSGPYDVSAGIERLRAAVRRAEQ